MCCRGLSKTKCVLDEAPTEAQGVTLSVCPFSDKLSRAVNLHPSRNGIVIDDKSVNAVINNVNDRHNIILIDKEDEGLYDCNASNYAGQAKKSIRVLGTECDPMLRSVFKMDNKDVYGDYFEVKLCTEETNKEDDILREFQSYSEMSEKNPLTYPKLEIRNFYLEKQSDVTEEGKTTVKTTESDHSGLARFSYIAQMRNTMEKEHNQSKIFIDVEKFNYIIKQYCDILKEKKTIDKNDILKIESKKKYESKPKQSMNKKSPDLAGLLKKVFSPISNVIENSLLNKIIKVSEDSNQKDSVSSDSKMSNFSNQTQETITATSAPDSIDGSISIGEIFGMSSTFIKTNDTFKEDKDKLNDDDIYIESQYNIEQAISTLEGIIGLSSSFSPQGSSNHSTLISNEENKESRGITENPSYLVENQTKDEFQEEPITLEKLFGLSSSLSSEDEDDDKKSNRAPAVFSQTQNILSSASEEEEDVPKIHFTSQSNFEQTISIEDMIGLSSSFLPTQNLNISILPSNTKIEDNKTDISDNSSYFRERRTEEELTDEPITFGEIFGLSSNFASIEESLIKHQNEENDDFDEGKQSSEIFSYPERAEEILYNKKPEPKDLGNTVLMSSNELVYKKDILPLSESSEKAEDKNDIFTTNIPITSDTIHDDYAFRSYSEEVGEEEDIDIFTTNTPITFDYNSYSEEAAMIKEVNSESDYPGQYIQKQTEKVTSQLQGLKKSNGERNLNLSFTYEEIYHNQENITADEERKEESAEEVTHPLLSFESGQKTQVMTLKDDDIYLVSPKTNETIITGSKTDYQKDYEKIKSTEEVLEKGKNNEMENSNIFATDLDDEELASYEETQALFSQQFTDDMLPSEEPKLLIQNLEKRVKEKSNLISTEMQPTPLYQVQQNATEEIIKQNVFLRDNGSSVSSDKETNEYLVAKNNVVKKDYSLEVLFMEEENASIDIDYPESVSIEKSSQESQSGSMRSPIFYIKQNNKKSNSSISYKPMFNTSHSKNPWYRKFEFFCVGKNVLMVLKKRTNIDD